MTKAGLFSFPEKGDPVPEPHKLVPITWCDWDECDSEQIQFNGVKFVEDFGVFKKDEETDSLFINYQEGKMQTFNNDDGEVLKEQKFKIVPFV